MKPGIKLVGRQMQRDQKQMKKKQKLKILDGDRNEWNDSWQKGNAVKQTKI